MTASREAGSSTAKVRSAQAGVSFCSAAVLFDLMLHLNAMEPFDNETRRWCVQMQARIGRGWTQDETSERNAMGIGDNGENIACVYGTGEGSTEVVYVGSSAALRCPTLEDHIHIMVSFGPPHLRNLVDRPQEGWDQFLRGLCIDHFAIQLADPKTTAPGEGPLCQKMANAYFFAWRSMCVLICRSRRNHKEHIPAGLLFHCLSGNNRSSAALVAWLIFRHHMTASEGIRLLLQARPTLNPWQERPHILWALKTWEMKMEETYQFVHSVVAEEIPRLTPELIRSALGGGLKVPLPIQVSTRVNYLERFTYSDGTPAPAEPRAKTVPRQAWEMAGQGYRQKRTKNTFVEPVQFQACWWIMAWSWEAFQSFYMDDAQVPPSTNHESKHGPTYANFCKTHAVRFANWDHRWLATLTGDCSAVMDVVALNCILAAYFQKCIPGPGEKSFLGFKGLHAAPFVDTEYIESFCAPITQKIAIFLPDARRGIE